MIRSVLRSAIACLALCAGGACDGILADSATARELAECAETTSASVPLIPPTSGEKDEAALRLIGELRDPDPKVQRLARSRLVSLGKSAVGPLIGTLDDRNPRVRRDVVYILADLRDSRAIEPLIPLLKDPKREVRQTAAWALGEIDGGQRGSHRKKSDSEAVEPLIGALDDPAVRFFAAVALGKIADARATTPLIRVINQDRREDTWPAVVEKARDGLAAIGTPAVAPLIAAMNGSNSRFRENVAWVLARMSQIPGVASVLLEKLQERDAAVIIGALEFFIEQGAPRSEDVLIAVLNGHDRRDVARLFLNSNNPRLADAAKRWASQHRYGIKTERSYGTSPRWGSAR